MRRPVLLGNLRLLATQVVSADQPAAVDRSHIVYFMIDELGYDDHVRAPTRFPRYPVRNSEEVPLC